MENTPFFKRIKRHVIGPAHEFFIATSPSLNQICRDEFLALPLSPEGAASVPGGVGFTGRLSDCFSANLLLRTANRILMRLGTFKATNFKALEDKTARIPWELHLREHSNIRIVVSVEKSRLYHREALAESVLSGILRRVPVSSGSREGQLILVRGVEDRFSLSLDSSGDLLYKRGVKLHGGRAPLRETLAAAALILGGYTPGKPLVDPMCGSGTFSIEAAMMAKNLPPGWFRNFAFMDWPAFKKPAWDHQRGAQADQIKSWNQPMVFASDVDSEACHRLQQCVLDHGLSDAVAVKTSDFFDLDPRAIPKGPGWVTLNPPYGQRLDTPEGTTPDFLEKVLRHLLDHYSGWSFILFLPDRKPLRALPSKKIQQVLPVFHGGLTVQLVTGRI